MGESLATCGLSDGGGDSGYSDADDVSGNIVLSQLETSYDSSGNVLSTTSRERFHNASGTGALGTATTGVFARVSYGGLYYDAGDRRVASVDVGTNGGSAWTRPGSVPSRSATVLVNSQTYDAAGRVYEVTDAGSRVHRMEYDALGRNFSGELSAGAGNR